ncbi:MAG TPA: ArsR family transcriptional regulator [Candidatus Nitrosopolaris sp.]|nr:ArsR family transcriptional regulator [Candidatus Nitrosopolaris sp.]
MKTESPESYTDSRDLSKAIILKQIDKSPGIRYRELLRLTGLTNGGLEYHLKILEKLHKVKVDRHDGRRTRYYPLHISTDESHILGSVRNSVARQIVYFILGHDLCTFGEIVEHIKKAPSTVSWHLKRLSEAGIISISYGQEYQLYNIVNSNLVKDVLYKYDESFIDRIANGYYETFGEL